MKEAVRTIDKYQPLWGSWKAAELIAQESGCELYRVYKEEWGKQYISTVKLLSFLIGKSDIREAQTIGLDPSEMPEYFKSLVGNIQNEIELMYRLRGNSNIVAYEDHVIHEKKDSQGWDVLIRMEYLQPLSCVISAQGLEAADVVKLGADICKALEACAREGIIHRDIKDSSIFVSPRGEYKLGSFSMAKELMKGGRTAMTSLSPLYMAPELYKEQGYDHSVDIYSLGLVMYKLLNRGRLPFLPLPPGTITADDAERALARRMSGEELPLPADSGESLGAIVLKACSYDKKDRYKSPAEFRQKLERFQKSGAKAAKTDGVLPVNPPGCIVQLSAEKEEADAEAEYVKELEKVAVVELAASIDKINNDRRLMKKKLVKNVAIWASVIVLTFIAAFFNAYKVEPVVEEPVAQPAFEPIQTSPSPTIDPTLTPEPTVVKSGEEYYQEGLTYLKKSRYGPAISAFEEAKKLGYEVKKSESQIRTARKRIEVQKLNSEAIKYYDQKEYEKAISAFAVLSGINAQSKSAVQYSDSFFRLAEEHNLSGVKYFNEGKLEQSLKEFDAALGMLERLKKETQNYDQARCTERYGIYSKNKSSLLEKTQKITEYLKLADECNRAGVQYFSEGSLDMARYEFENALSYLEKIRLLVPEYKDVEYTGLLKICEDNLKSIKSKL